jgi:hypothetical protein
VAEGAGSGEDVRSGQRVDEQEEKHKRLRIRGRVLGASFSEGSRVPGGDRGASHKQGVPPLEAVGGAKRNVQAITNDCMDVHHGIASTIELCDCAFVSCGFCRCAVTRSLQMHRRESYGQWFVRLCLRSIVISRACRSSCRPGRPHPLPRLIISIHGRGVPAGCHARCL